MIRIYIAFLTLLTAFPFAALAVDAAEQEQIRIEQEGRNRLEELRRQEAIEQLREYKRQYDKEKIQREQKKKETPADTPCFHIDQIDFQGATILSKRKKMALTKPFLGTCMSYEEINQLDKDITNYYFSKGFVTTAIYIPEQDLTKGTLTMKIVEGVLEDIVTTSEKWYYKPSLYTAFPGLKGKLLSLRKIEQGLDQINRLPTSNATMQIRPGSKPGTSVLEVSDKRRFFLQPWLQIDNQGQDSTGKNRAVMGLNIGNMLLLNDSSYVSLTEDIKKDEAHALQSFIANISVPFGDWTFRYSHSNSASKSTTLTNLGARLVSRVFSRSNAIEVDRIVFRNKQHKLKAFAGVGISDNKREIAGVVQNDRQDLSVVSGGIDHFLVTDYGLLNTRLRASFGTDWLSADKDPDFLRDDDPVRQFEKYDITLTYLKGFKLFKRPMNYTLGFTGQISPDHLYGLHAVTIGGPYSVRGFYNKSLSGDKGYFVRNDLSTSLPLEAFKNKLLPRLNMNVSPYVFADFGYVRPKDNVDTGSLAGAGMGMRLNSKHVAFDINFAKGLKAPDFLGKEETVILSSLKVTF